ncbi:MAG: flagellar hook-length control protein FliK [Porticoccaceae bacterium]
MRNKTTEPREPALLPVVTPDAGGSRGGDAAGAAPAASRAVETGPPSKSIDPPVGQPGWGRELGSRILWLAKDNQQYAELRLNPPQLGPLEVRISLQPDQGASVSFLSNHTAVRDALTGALPQLREMFADGGITLTDVNVSHHSASHEQSRSTGQDASGLRGTGAQEVMGGADNDGERQRQSLQFKGAGLVDYFV